MPLIQRPWMLAIASLGFVASTALASAPSPRYECPAELTIQKMSYPLSGAQVFSGPMEDRAILVPQFTGQRSSIAVWPPSDGPLSFVQCSYQGTKHSIVLNIEGAQSCQARLEKDRYASLSCQ